MPPGHNDIDLPSLIPNVSDSLGDDTPPACSSPTTGFTLHKAKMGREFTLVKVFNGLPQGSLSSSESKKMSKAFLEELGFWKQNFSTTHFVFIMGRSDYIDSILPSPVYQQTAVAKDHLKELKETSFLSFILHIAEGVEYLHQKNVKHGDIRADNILVGSDGLPRIADYGLSRIICLLDKFRLRDKTDVSAAMRWMPPEFMQLEDDAPYAPSTQGDIWSLGMTIFELWSGNIPYRGTRLERVPSKIVRGQLPEFPGELKPDLEKLREHISFLCELCWQRNAASRKTAAELVHILRELVERRDLPTLRGEFRITQHQHQFLTKGHGTSFFFPGGGSISSSDTRSSSVADSMEELDVRNLVSPSEGSDSGYETVRNHDPLERTIKTESFDEDNTVSGWSYQSRPRGTNVGASGAPQPTPNIQTGGKTLPHQERETSCLKPFSAFPPPPSPDSPWSSISSHMTALLNYKAKNKVSLNITQKAKGDDHQPLWTTICTIQGEVYGRSTDAKKKVANENAAREALSRLYDENPSSATESSPSYLSSFKSYLAENELTDRIKMPCVEKGEAHVPIWTCSVMRDGKLLARGVGATKQKATEQAARNAVVVWGDS